MISAAECNSTAEALKALCGSVPGYTGIGVKDAAFKEGLISLRDSGAKITDGSSFLTGADAEAWRDWRRVLLRSPSVFQEVIARKGRVAPHTDPELKRKPQSYARLARDVGLRGLVSFGAPSEAAAGVFCGPEEIRESESAF